MDRAKAGASVLDALIARKPMIDVASAFSEPLLELWRRGLPAGDKPGWSAVDKLYSVLPGMLTVITGWPGAGKSEFLDHMLMNLADHAGWKFAIHSPENQPIELHISKLVEKVVRKPFGTGPNERVSEAELEHAVQLLDRSFAFMHSATGSLALGDIIEAAAPYLERFGPKRGLVIDPFNELEHWRPQGQTETEYVSQFLSTLRNWARATQTHVWIVAHPQKYKREQSGKLPVPRPDMISGSQHWWNKADACLAVDRPDEMSPSVDIYVQKMRFKHLGHVGMATLIYDRVTGRYHDEPVLSPNVRPDF